MLSRIHKPKNSASRSFVQLTRSGEIAEKYIQNIPVVYPGVFLEKYVIMPNHVHLLILIEEQSSVSVPGIIRSLKRMVNNTLGQSIWQDSYYDVVIRNDAMFRCEWLYIDNNPDKWIEDELYVP